MKTHYDGYFDYYYYSKFNPEGPVFRVKSAYIEWSDNSFQISKVWWIQWLRTLRRKEDFVNKTPFPYKRTMSFQTMLLVGGHFQSNIDIFASILCSWNVKAKRDVPPLFCFNVQTNMRFFLLQQLLSPEGRCCENELLLQKYHFSLHVLHWYD